MWWREAENPRSDVVVPVWMEISLDFPNEYVTQVMGTTVEGGIPGIETGDHFADIRDQQEEIRSLRCGEGIGVWKSRTSVGDWNLWQGGR